jgi:hypothetical protein
MKVWLRNLWFFGGSFIHGNRRFFDLKHFKNQKQGYYQNQIPIEHWWLSRSHFFVRTSQVINFLFFSNPIGLQIGRFSYIQQQPVFTSGFQNLIIKFFN